MQNPSIEEIHKFHLVMMGCSKNTIEEAWIKKMLNWDLFTHPESSEFNLSTSDEEKSSLSQDWKHIFHKMTSRFLFMNGKENPKILRSR
jgi:hypothetical protein